MAKIQFDPELMRNIKIIYGDADLDERTLRLLYQTWATNPDIIKRTALQKMPKMQETYFDAPEMSPLPTRLEPLPATEIVQNDLSGIASFNLAFAEAKRRGLKLFKWKETKANPSGLFGTELANTLDRPELSTILLAPLSDYQTSIKSPDQIASTKGATWGKGLPTITGGRLTTSELGRRTEQPLVDSVLATINRLAARNTVQGGDFGINSGLRKAGQAIGNGFMGFLNWLNEGAANNLYNKNRQVNRLGYHQQGGTMNNQQELQKAFMAFLILDAQALGIQLLSEQDLLAYAEQLGEDGIKAKYQEFMQKMQGGVMARLGAKLEYYKKLKGVCPEGEELVYFKQGGRICKACQKALKGTRVKDNEVDKFKKGRAQYKKDMKSAKDEASRDSISINKYNDLETMSNKGHKGNFQKGKWVPDRKQYTKKDACGSKMKVSKCGSKMKK